MNLSIVKSTQRHNTLYVSTKRCVDGTYTKQYLTKAQGVVLFF